VVHAKVVPTRLAIVSTFIVLALNRAPESRIAQFLDFAQGTILEILVESNRGNGGKSLEDKEKQDGQRNGKAGAVHEFRINKLAGKTRPAMRQIAGERNTFLDRYWLV
jgi:hypothetical protein